MVESSVNNRIRDILKEVFHGNVTAMAKSTSIARTTINSIVGSDEVTPRFDVLKRIGEISSPRISMEWLIRGTGGMIKNSEAEVATSSKDGTGIPLIPVDAMAGCFTGEQAVLLQECERYVVPAFSNADFLIHVSGDSMVPRYFSGDMVACKRLSLTDIFFQWGKVYVIDTDQGALIKKVEPGTTDESIMLVSENEKYKPFELPRRSIYRIALVLGLIRVE